eukprot:9066442-Pyramimonas_sp.AAC.1
MFRCMERHVRRRPLVGTRHWNPWATEPDGRLPPRSIAAIMLYAGIQKKKHDGPTNPERDIDMWSMD